MLIVLAAAIAAPQPALPPGVSEFRQARATVRIISGVRIASDRPPVEALVRDTQLRGLDGSQEPARLIEFP